MGKPERNKVPPILIATTSGEVVPFSILDRYALKSGEGESRQLESDPFKDRYSGMNLITPPYNLTALAGLGELNVYHQRCITCKVQDIIGNGFSIEPLEDKAGETDKKILDDFFEDQWPPIEDILEKFVTDYESTGVAYLEMTREGGKSDGKPKKILHIPANTIRIKRGGNLFCQVRGNKKVWFKAVGYEKDVHYQAGTEHPLDSLSPLDKATEIIYLRRYSSRSSFYGIPEFLGALGAIEGHVAQRDYNVRFFENFGVPSFAIYISGDYNIGEPDENGEYPIITAIKEQLQLVVQNPHSPLIFAVPGAEKESKVEVKFERLSTEVKDSSFRLYKQDNRDEVIVGHGVPPYRVGVYTTGSLGGNLAEESTRIYFQSTIYPRQNKIANCLTRNIINHGFDIWNWKITLEKPSAGTRGDDLEEAIKLFDKAVLTPNDLIRKFGAKYSLEPSDDPAMDWHYLAGKPIDASELPEPASEGELGVVKEFYGELLKIASKKR